jgi:hypothetical protein
MQEEVLKSTAGRRKLVRSLPLWEEAQRQFLSQIGTKSLQELQTLLSSAESAVTKAYTAPGADRWRSGRRDRPIPEQSLSNKNGCDSADFVGRPHRRRRFGLDGSRPKTLEEVGRKFGITRERIRQLQNIALAKLRAALSKKEAPTPKPITASTTVQILGSTNRA